MKISRSYIAMIVLSLSFLLGGCSQDVSTSSQSQLVVEGWIDAGGFPVVKLTRTIPLSDDALSLDSLSRYMDRWAKVGEILLQIIPATLHRQLTILSYHPIIKKPQLC